jgi:UDP-N-acetylmuramate: L-alanyl-gamma-D-glutamyl-meso-diaminopimelate ligase
LGRFRNVKRRMEVRGRVNDITVYDDFAHHPTAIKTTLDGLRARLRDAADAPSAVGAPQSNARSPRILAVLEPRSNTMKLGVMKAALSDSLSGADLIFGYGAASGRDALGWNLSETLSPLGQRAAAFDDLDTLVSAVCAAARPGDQILVMSNGGFGGVHQKLLDALAVSAAARAHPA